MERGYRRPLICRFCRFPAVDGAVQMSELDQDNLSEWCRFNLDTIMDVKQQEALLCQFCVWDARFMRENSTKKNEKLSGNWWKERKRKFDHNYQYYLDEKLKPCAVKIVELSEESLEKYRRKGGKNITKDEVEKQDGGQKLSEDENSCDIIWIAPIRTSVIQLCSNNKTQSDNLNDRNEISKVVSKIPLEQGAQINQEIEREELKLVISKTEESAVHLKVEEKDPPTQLKAQISNPPTTTKPNESDSNNLQSRSEAAKQIKVSDKLNRFKFFKVNFDAMGLKAPKINIKKAAVNRTEQKQALPTVDQVDLIKVNCMFCNKLLPKRYLQSHIIIFHKNEVTCFVKTS